MVYRAIVDYDETTEEARILILAFDKYIKDKKIIVFSSQVKVENLPAQNLDVDIAYGYETVSLSSVETDSNVKNIISQITTKYSQLIKGKSLQTIEVLELKSGKLNYKITYFDPATHLTVKFIVYYNPVFNKILLLNPVNLPSSQKFEEMSEEQKIKDPLLKKILELLYNLHKEEMDGNKLQCVSKGYT